ncbi:chemotaxis protein CheW [Clostridium psychrophilum]|uniref:chemotaxis protein CheW n=1 Tax=Clostridium psychrophilum TaxID=132926 RepID=UPI001C0DDCF6|nr:chemotaxis protein CheW [Clostridium psychrophilum]MBU3180679.1 chemotaxis protein CheW [Clostridium psychrophilum]
MKQQEVKILVFKIKDEYYATNINEVERILACVKTAKIPDSPEFVEGVMNYENSILPIISLAKIFKLPSSVITEESKIIIIRQNDSKIGIIVDGVSEVKDIVLDNIEDPPDIIKGISKGYIKGLIRIDGKIIIYLNMSQILTNEQKKQIL